MIAPDSKLIKSNLNLPIFNRPSSEPMVMPIRTPTPETVKSRADIKLSPAPTPSPKQSPLPWRPVQAPAPAAPIQPVAAPAAPSPAISKPEPIRPAEVTLHMAAPSQPAAPMPKESELLKYIKEAERLAFTLVDVDVFNQSQIGTHETFIKTLINMAIDCVMVFQTGHDFKHLSFVYFALGLLMWLIQLEPDPSGVSCINVFC